MKYYKQIEEDSEPSKIIVCRCKQCKGVKRQKKNRNITRNVKRMLNKKRRSSINSYIVYCWA